MISIEERMEIIQEMEREQEILRELDIQETLRMEWEQKEEARRRKDTDRARHTVIIEGFPFYDKNINVLEPILQP